MLSNLITIKYKRERNVILFCILYTQTSLGEYMQIKVNLEQMGSLSRWTIIYGDYPEFADRGWY